MDKTDSSLNETPQMQLIEQALDGIWGTCDNLLSICNDMIDAKDARLSDANDALCKAQDAISELLPRK